MEDAIAELKPIAGLVEMEDTPTGEMPVFKVVHRRPVKTLVRRSLLFEDDKGTNFHGLWCADIQLEEEGIPAASLSEVQSKARLSAVAIPLWYVLGKNSANATKYCVITNWWKYRMKNGTYCLPKLEPEMYDHCWKEHMGSTQNSGQRPEFAVI